jgi:hypothetical protein
MKILKEQAEKEVDRLHTDLDEEKLTIKKINEKKDSL